MHVRIIQSKDSDWDFSEEIRSAVEEKIQPLTLDFKMVDRFYEVVNAVSPSADVNIVLFFPKKEELSIAGPILLELLRKDAHVVYYPLEDVPAYEDEILSKVLSVFGL